MTPTPRTQTSTQPAVILVTPAEVAGAVAGFWAEDEGPDDFDVIIDAYSRADMLEDGGLVDVSDMAAQQGLRYPTAVTAAVWAKIKDFAPGSGQDVTGRLWDVLFMAKIYVQRAAARNGAANRVTFPVYMAPNITPGPESEDAFGDDANDVIFEIVVGPGDQAEPVFTIQFPGED